MARIKTNITFTNTCILSSTDTTGFKSSTNLDGFVPEDGDYETIDDYKISDGYFINVILYHKYYGDPLLVNKNDQYIKIDSADVKPNYADNFLPDHFTLTKDGVYSFKRLFVISKEFYDTNVASGIFDTKTVIYYDGDNALFIKTDGETTEELSLYQVAMEYSNQTTGTFISYKFVSTCNLNKCFYLLQKLIVESNTGVCPDSTFKDLSAKRDFVHMTLQVIKYLREDGHLNEIQRLIEGVDTCGVVCKSISTRTKTDCGCNG